MNIKTTFICLSLVVAFSCISEEEIQIQSFYNESFSNLDLTTFQQLETPYESTFSRTPTGGRVEEGFEDLATIAQKLAEIFPDADILEVELEEERGLSVWTFKVKMPGGGIVKFKFVQDLGEIIKMKGKTGPFDYEIDPGGSFIAFSKAKELALDAVGGEIRAWSLELEENNNWEYEFHIVSGDKRYEVEINGMGEEVISIKEKNHDQDEDDDGDDEGENEDEDDDDHENNIDLSEEVLNFVNEIFEGTVKHAEKRESDHGTYYKIYMINADESVIKIVLKDGDELSLNKIEGERGPFGYNVEPGMELLDLQTVLEDVYRETENGELIEWELEMEEVSSQEHRWVYEFKVRREGVWYEIEVNAADGEFLKFEIHD